MWTEKYDKVKSNDCDAILHGVRKMIITTYSNKKVVKHKNDRPKMT